MLVALAGCGSNQVQQTIPSIAATPLTISLTPQAISEASLLNPVVRNPLINVTVGGTSLPMLLDTGSSGVRIYAPAIPAAAYTDQNVSDNATFGTFGSATQYTYEGDLATADIQVGGVDLGVQPFQIVRQVVGNSSISNEMQTKGMGVFGVAPTPPDPAGVVSLMGRFPGFLGSGFIISLYKNQMTVGITPQARTQFALYPVAIAMPAASPPYWQTPLFEWCYGISIPGLSSVTNACLNNTFTDTGGLNAHLYFTSLAPPVPLPMSTATAMPANTLTALPLQSILTASLQDTSGRQYFTWSSPPEGTCSGYDVVNVWFGNGGGSGANSNGINPFFSLDVMYDLADSNIGFQAAPPALMPPSFCPAGT